MSISKLVLKIDSLVQNPTLDRTVKAVIAVLVAQGTLYTTVVPNPPSLPVSAGVAGGSGLLVAIISLIITWAEKKQSPKTS